MISGQGLLIILAGDIRALHRKDTVGMEHRVFILAGIFILFLFITVLFYHDLIRM